MIQYSLAEETYELNGNSRISYGIIAYEISDRSAEQVAQVHDLGTDREKIEDLVYCCNQTNLSIAHLYDVVEDFLCFWE